MYHQILLVFLTLTGSLIYFRQTKWLFLVFGSKSLRKRIKELAQGGIWKELKRVLPKLLLRQEPFVPAL